MNSLILANNAPDYFRFFNPLAEELEKLGTVQFALDSTYSKKYNEITSEDCFIFSNFCEKVTPQDIEEVSDVIAKIQNEFGTWFLYPDADRDFYFHTFSKNVANNQYQLFCNLIAFFVDIFKNNKIDYVFYENASNALVLVAREIARMYGAKFVGITIARLPGRISLLDKWENEDEDYSVIFEQLSSGKLIADDVAKAYVESYIKNFEDTQPDYMYKNPLNVISIAENYANLDKLKVLLFKTRFLFKKTKWDFQIGNPFRSAYLSFYRNIKRKIKVALLKDLFEPFQSQTEDKYYLYPLHFHPEASTSLLAREYGCEYDIIRNIAYSLPYGTKLYVKDHVSAYGYPSLSFYQKLKQLPNVHVITPHAPTKEMIRKSIGIITLTSTVGYEALLLNKPVTILGEGFYKFHKNCFQCDSLKSIGTYLIKMKNDDMSLEKNYNQLFLYAYYLGTKKIKLDYLDKDSSNQKKAVKELLVSLKLG